MLTAHQKYCACGQHTPFDGPVVARVDGVDQTVGERLAKQIFVKSFELITNNPGRAELEPVDARNIDNRTLNPGGKPRKERTA